MPKLRVVARLTRLLLVLLLGMLMASLIALGERLGYKAPIERRQRWTCLFMKRLVAALPAGDKEKELYGHVAKDLDAYFGANAEMRAAMGKFGLTGKTQITAEKAKENLQLACYQLAVALDGFEKKLPSTSSSGAELVYLAKDSVKVTTRQQYKIDEVEVKAKIEEIGPGLPEGVTIEAVYDRSELIHRAIETLWKSLEKALKRVGKGQDADLDVTDVHQLVTAYAAHAGYEEKEFLPLSEAILGRNSNHMAALGLSLHMRHVKPVNAYI